MTIMISPKTLPVALNLHAGIEDTLFGQSTSPFPQKSTRVKKDAPRKPLPSVPLRNPKDVVVHAFGPTSNSRPIVHVPHPGVGAEGVVGASGDLVDCEGERSDDV